MASLVIQLAGVIAVIIAAGFALAIFSLSLPPEEKSREATPHSAPGKAAAHVPPRERAHVQRTAAETTHTKEGKSQNEQNE